MRGLLLLALMLADARAVTVIVTFTDNLPVSVGNGTDASAPTPQVAPVNIPGVTLVADLPFLGEAIYSSVDPDVDYDTVCDLIMMRENVETCEPDSGTILDQTATPNDPNYSQQTYLNTTNTVGLWQQGVFGNRNVRIGIIDSGVDLANPDLLPSLWTNPNTGDDGSGAPGDTRCASFLGGVGSGDCQDQQGHGTWVAGAIGAVSNDNLLISGAVQLPTLVICKYIDSTGNGQISDALLCFNWLASKNVQVISCSWGTSSNSNGLQQALSKLSSAGVFISTSAGNNGVSTDTSPQYPSAYSATMSAVVGVAAVDSTGALWSRSNYGNMTVQLAAPGVSLIGLGLGNTTLRDTGSSMSAPQVSAVAGLLLGQFQAAGFDVGNTNGLGQAIKSALISGSTTLPPTSGKSIGGGLVSGTGAWTALQKSQIYQDGPSHRPSNLTGTSSVTTAVVYILVGFGIASVVFAVVLALVLRARKRPPKPIDLTGINFRTAQMPSTNREELTESA